MIALILASVIGLVAVLSTPPAAAQGRLRFVASYGNDVNSCFRAQPCRTLQRGHDETPAGGELQILDSGEFSPEPNWPFGLLIINKSITVSAVGVSAELRSSGVTIAVEGANNHVVLRGLHLRARDALAEAGIYIDTAANNAPATVSVEDCIIENYRGSGISAFNFLSPTKLFVSNTIIRFNRFYGLRARNAVIRKSQLINNGWDASGGAGAFVGDSTIVDSTFSYNDDGIDAFSGRVTVERTVFSRNRGTALHADNQATLVIDRSLADDNAIGLQAEPDGGEPHGVAVVSNSTFVNNQIGIQGNDPLPSPPRVFSGGNNTVSGNTTDLTGTVTAFPPT